MKLYLSLTALLQAFSHDEVDGDALMNARFFFLTSRREHVMDAANSDPRNAFHKYFANNPERGQSVRALLSKVLESAEIDGRVEYVNWTGHSDDRWNILDNFLLANGLQEVLHNSRYYYEHFLADEVRYAIHYTNPDVDILT